jgi:hypothetical protein
MLGITLSLDGRNKIFGRKMFCREWLGKLRNVAA